MLVPMPTWDQVQLQTSLRNFIVLTDPRAQVLLNALPDQRAKLQVYTLGLQDIVDNKELRAAASLAGFRYLAAANDFGVAATAQTGGTMTSLGAGQQILQATTAFNAVKRLKEIQDRAFELVVLQVPGVRVEAYWLRLVNGPGDTDLLYPYLSRIPEVPTMSLKSPQAFLAALRPAAQRDLKAFQGYQPQREPRQPKPAGP